MHQIKCAFVCCEKCTQFATEKHKELQRALKGYPNPSSQEIPLSICMHIFKAHGFPPKSWGLSFKGAENCGSVKGKPQFPGLFGEREEGSMQAQILCMLASIM